MLDICLASNNSLLQGFDAGRRNPLFDPYKQYNTHKNKRELATYINWKIRSWKMSALILIQTPLYAIGEMTYAYWKLGFEIISQQNVNMYSCIIRNYL